MKHVNKPSKAHTYTQFGPNVAQAMNKKISKSETEKTRLVDKIKVLPLKFWK